MWFDPCSGVQGAVAPYLFGVSRGRLAVPSAASHAVRGACAWAGAPSPSASTAFSPLFSPNVTKLPRGGRFSVQTAGPQRHNSPGANPTIERSVSRHSSERLMAKTCAWYLPPPTRASTGHSGQNCGHWSWLRPRVTTQWRSGDRGTQDYATLPWGRTLRLRAGSKP